MPTIRIRTVRSAPRGFRENVVALASITLIFDSADDPVKLVRWSKKANDGEGEEFEVGSLSGGVLRLDDIPYCIWNDQKTGESRYYVQTGAFKFSREVADAIVEMIQQHIRSAPRAPQAQQQTQQQQTPVIGTPTPMPGMFGANRYDVPEGKDPFDAQVPSRHQQQGQ